MEPGFWHKKWDAQQIGFHQNEVNPLLIKYWPRLKLSPSTSSTVFVPLCGKTLDICFLAELGHEVIGCELNATAVEHFFTENDLSYSTTPVGELQKFVTEQVSIFQGDLFSLSPELLSGQEAQGVDAFYDRAALIAWPEEMRRDYVEKLAALIPPKSIGLLITLDYPQEALKGPPFAVSNDWVVSNMDEYFEIELLACEDVLNENPRFIKKEVPWLTESVYRLVRKGEYSAAISS
ncbi:thiopurine S-methyltransferase [uncultured Shewanella sp.]|uniref:thiopurine S-methyltransferase n=1 Tax=Shewanella atlantica TaxID=271099 RepID=UPI002624A2FB|nr:thiopurine S-methyltransferase [uncultured Shewanella sp.]